MTRLTLDARGAAQERRREERTASAIVANVQDLVGTITGLAAAPVDVSFFELGMDSLQVLMLADELEQRFGFMPSIDDLFVLENIRDIGAFYEGELARRVQSVAAPDGVLGDEGEEFEV